MAKRACDFFQSLANLMKGYVSEGDEEVKEAPAKKSKKQKKRAPELSSKKTKKSHPANKPERDPDAPKKPLPAFLLFSNTKRREMKEKNVSTLPRLTSFLGLPLNERLRKIEIEWANMSKAEKDVSIQEDVGRSGTIRQTRRSKSMQWK